MERNKSLVKRNNSKNMLKEIIETDFSSLPKAYDLYVEFLGKSEIEKHKEEDFVLRELLRGTKEKIILDTLKTKYPEELQCFTKKDLLKFIERNKEITTYLERDRNITARRHIEAKTQVLETLAGLSKYTERMIIELREEKDNTNAIAAMRVLIQTLKNVSELQGFIKSPEDGQPVKNIINIISDKYDLKDKAHRAEFKILDNEDIDGKV